MIDLINRYPDRDPVLIARTSSHGEYVGVGLNRGTKCTDATTCDSDSACAEGYRCYIPAKEEMETADPSCRTTDSNGECLDAVNVPWWVPGCGMSETYVCYDPLFAWKMYGPPRIYGVDLSTADVLWSSVGEQPTTDTTSAATTTTTTTTCTWNPSSTTKTCSGALRDLFDDGCFMT